LEEEFAPLLCPRCGGVVGELLDGRVRLLCARCRVKVVFSRVQSEKIPPNLIYLIASPEAIGEPRER
jgi:hypothetical protein